jgi:Ca-activated chloride channel family protein
MTIGERRIRGILRAREDAEQIYNQARAQGYQASLLTQHRPNVFEQKVANIEPGKAIDINIRYYETLAYQDGWYSFVFPTVVGPRYNPANSPDPLLALPQTEWRPTSADAVRYMAPGTTSAHDISIAVELNPGVAIEEIDSSHELETRRGSDDIVHVSLRDGATLPNKDFRLNFRIAGDTIKSNLLTYVDDESGEGYFTLMLYPPEGLENLRRQPLELVFVLDCSGSMSGAPLAQAKAAILAALDRLEPSDTFQIIRFSNSSSQLGAMPVAATPENILIARNYLYGLNSEGGTEMITGIRAALGFPKDAERLRFVSFLTDGYIGNEAQILGKVDRLLGSARIFSFGVGSAPNRYLLERMAGIGRGAVAYLSLQDSGRVVMDAFFDRIAHPAMLDVEIDYGSMAVMDVFPSRLPDLFVGRPVVVTGRFTGRPGDVELEGRAGGERVAVTLDHDGDSPEHSFLPNLWARLKIAELEDRVAVEPGSAGILAAQIRQTAIDYELMSDYTSFVAVDASTITEGRTGTTVYQAVPVPEGARYESTVER